MTILSMQILAALSLGIMSGGSADRATESGYSASFVGSPYSCRYDLRPVVIGGVTGSRVASFEQPLGSDLASEEIRSKTPAFQVYDGDTTLTLDIAYAVQSTPSSDPLAIPAMQEYQKTGGSVAWWIHRLVLIDAVTGKDLEVVDYTRFAVQSELPPSSPSQSRSVSIDLRRYAGRTLQFGYISTGFTFAHSREARTRVVVEKLVATGGATDIR